MGGEGGDMLKCLQRNYLRIAAGGMKTIPTEELETALCICPLNLVILGVAYNTVYKLRR